MPAALIVELDRYVQVRAPGGSALGRGADALEPAPRAWWRWLTTATRTCASWCARASWASCRRRRSAWSRACARWCSTCWPATRHALPLPLRHAARRSRAAAPQEPDLDVALESCEFWCAYCEAELSPDYYTVLREFIPQLIPVLLTNMAYAEDDEARAAPPPGPTVADPLRRRSSPPRRRSCAATAPTATRTSNRSRTTRGCVPLARRECSRAPDAPRAAAHGRRHGGGGRGRRG